MLSHVSDYGRRFADRLCNAAQPTGGMWWNSRWFGLLPHQIDALNAHAAKFEDAGRDAGPRQDPADLPAAG